MRYEPPTSERAPPRVTRTGTAVYQPVSALRSGERDEAARRWSAELDIWEDEGSTTVGGLLEFPGRHAEQNFDVFPG